MLRAINFAKDRCNLILSLIEKHYIFLVIIFACSFSYQKDQWFSKWTLLIGLVFATFYYPVRCLLGKLPALGLIYILINSIYTYGSRFGMYSKDFPPGYESTFGDFGGFSTICFASMFFCVLFTEPKIIEKIERYIGILCLISSSLIIIGFLFNNVSHFDAGGFFEQASMEGTFIAITYPFLVSKKEKTGNAFFNIICVLFPWIACVILNFKCGASQPIIFMSLWLLLQLQFLYFGDPNLKKVLSFKLINKISFLLLIISAIGLISYRLNPYFFRISDRYVVYEMAMEFFFSHDKIRLIHGYGMGSWHIWAVILQEHYKVNPGANFIFMHSDYLQVLWEHGFVGLLFMISIGILAMRRAYASGKNHYFEACIVYALAMIFNFPMHLAIHSILGVFIFVVSLRHRVIKN